MTLILGDIDLHLFGEGRHEEIYKKLGAHVTKAGRTKGVAFAVWAPHASGVSVVGDFNSLGRTRPPDANVRKLRCLGTVHSQTH